MTVKGSYDEDRACCGRSWPARRPSRACASASRSLPEAAEPLRADPARRARRRRGRAGPRARRGMGARAARADSPWRRAARRRAASRRRSTRRSSSSATGRAEFGRAVDAAAEQLTGRDRAAPARTAAAVQLRRRRVRAHGPDRRRCSSCRWRPVTGTVWVAERIQEQAEAEYYDEGAIQAQLREIDAARAGRRDRRGRGGSRRGRAAGAAAGGARAAMSDETRDEPTASSRHAT